MRFVKSGSWMPYVSYGQLVLRRAALSSNSPRFLCVGDCIAGADQTMLSQTGIYLHRIGPLLSGRNGAERVAGTKKRLKEKTKERGKRKSPIG